MSTVSAAVPKRGEARNLTSTNNQGIPLAHHQIDLAASAAVIAFQQTQPSCLKVGAGETLRVAAAPCRSVGGRYRHKGEGPLGGGTRSRDGTRSPV